MIDTNYRPGLNSVAVRKNFTGLLADKVEIFWPMGHIVQLKELEITMSPAPPMATTESTTITS